MMMALFWFAIGLMVGFALGEWMIIGDLREARRELEKAQKRLHAYEIFAIKKLKQRAQRTGVEIDADE